MILTFMPVEKYKAATLEQLNQRCPTRYHKKKPDKKHDNSINAYKDASPNNSQDTHAKNDALKSPLAL